MRIARRGLTIAALTVVLLYLLICIALFVFQRSLIYYPQPRSNRIASTLLTIPLSTGTVEVSTHLHAGPDALIYFGGNAEDVSLDVVDLSAAFPASAIYALHYPGYGGSSGTPSQDAIFAAALALYDRVHTDHGDVVVIGRSLGSGAAVWLASQRPVSRLVLVTPFDNLGDVAQQQYPFLPVRLLLRDKFDSGKYAPKVVAPTHILIAEHDELVPRSSSDDLTARFRAGIASSVVLPNVGHNDIQDDPHYSALLSGQ